jgi:hypothetical protein
MGGKPGRRREPLRRLLEQWFGKGQVYAVCRRKPLRDMYLRLPEGTFPLEEGVYPME